MANKQLFASRGRIRQLPKVNTINEAGGTAYAFDDAHALAQYAVTGTLYNTFYASAGEQLSMVEGLASKVDPEFLAKVAAYAHRIGRMKDIPAYLAAYLVANGHAKLLTKKASIQGINDHTSGGRTLYDQIISNGKMLSNFVQIIRSGALGRKSFGTTTKRLIQNWILSRNPMQLYLTSVGLGAPTMADIIKMVHPRPNDAADSNLYAYLADKPYEESLLPIDLQRFEALKRGEYFDNELPDVPFRVLTNLKLSEAQWKSIARNMPWNTLRMNLNMLGRHGIYSDDHLVTELANKLSDCDEVRKSNAFPYQLLTAFQSVDASLPMKLKLALQDALEAATENVPSFNGRTAVLVDVSGSMGSAVTGHRGTATSVTRCVDVAALMASCVLRKNPDAVIVQFDTSARGLTLNPRDSVMTNARAIACNGGGTDISCGLRYLRQLGIKFDNVIIISDNESWCGYHGYYTGSAAEWYDLHQKNKNAKLVNIDIQAYASSQVPDKKDEVLNIGGFSDSVFDVIAKFLNRDNDDNFVTVIEKAVSII